MTPAYRIEGLGRHDRSKFSCGEPDLDRYFRHFVSQDVRRRLAKAYVAVTGEEEVAGFYTLSAAAVRHEELPQGSTRKLPLHPELPAALLGRLAVGIDHRATGLGLALLTDAIASVERANIGVCMIVVAPKGDRAAAFYSRHGFLPMESEGSRLFLPLAIGRSALGG